jgi:hypothetical protein
VVAGDQQQNNTGEQDQSNGVDREDRLLEVVKLRIAFMQHITTLSGAAIVIIVALAERAEPPKQAILLMSSIIYFLAAALIAVTGVVGLLLRLMQKEQGVGSGRGTTGTYTTLLAGIVFSVGMLNVASYVTGGTRSLLEQKAENIQLFGSALAALIILIISTRFILPWAPRRFYGINLDEPPR